MRAVVIKMQITDIDIKMAFDIRMGKSLLEK